MKVKPVKKIAVAGAGTMGAGIAQMAALAGYETLLYDIKSEALDKARAIINKNLDGGIKRGKVTEDQKKDSLNRITFTKDFEKVKGDLVLEAVIEDLEVKQELFLEINEQTPNDTIFASNTSSIPLTRIGNKIPHPERVVGMHFFNPVHIMKLVEVISGVATAPEIAESARKVAGSMGKTAVMANDSPGFIVNRVARHYYVESLKLVEENVAGFKEIDNLLVATGFKMGPFRLMDLIGVDTNFSVTRSMFNAFHQTPKFRPSLVQQKKVEAGHHGRKTGQGFYNYE